MQTFENAFLITLFFPQQASAADELKNCDRLFLSLIRALEERREDVEAEIMTRQKETESRSQSLIDELQRETAELQGRNADLEELLHTEDHLHLLQVTAGLQLLEGGKISKKKTSRFHSVSRDHPCLWPPHP